MKITTLHRVRMDAGIDRLVYETRIALLLKALEDNGCLKPRGVDSALDALAYEIRAESRRVLACSRRKTRA